MRERRPRTTDDLAESRADDWLGTVGDLDWSGEEEPPRPRPPRASPVPPLRLPARRGETPDDVISRRRAVAGLVLALLVIGALAAVLLLARGGGNSGTPPAATTTPPATTAEQPAPSPTPAPSPAPSPSPAAPLRVPLPAKGKIRTGDKGAGSGVRTLQRALAALGFDPGGIDGIFGPKTEAAVVAFQQQNGLDADGVVGPKTAAKLDDALAAKGVTA